MFKLVIADDEGKTTTVPLVRDEITIGRKEGNTIRLTDRNVSRRHARLQKQNGHYLLQDLGSYNGIVINGARLSDARPLRHGDQILIGDYKLAITEEASAHGSVPMPPGSSPVSNGAAETLGEAPLADVGPKIHPAATEPGIPSAKVSNGATASAAGPPPVPQVTAGAASAQPSVPARTSSPPPAPMAQTAAAGALTVPPPADLPEDLRQLRLVFLSPHGVPPPVVLERLPLILGRSEAADIALPFPSISREHARLFAEDGQLMIEDLGSSNGILINGEKLPRTRITPGDLVTLGVVEFRVARRGDSTMVVHREAEAQKVAIAKRSPLPVIGGVLGGGVVLGLIVFVMMRGGLTARVDTPPPAVISPVPVGPTVAPLPLPAATATAPVEPVAPAPEPVAPAPPDPVQPAVAVAPTAPDPVRPVAVEPRVHEPESHASAPHVNRPPAHHVSEAAVASAQPLASPTPSNPPVAHPASAGSTSNPASSGSSSSAAAAPPADLMTAARTAARSSDNATVVHLLEGHATTEPELGLLAVTYRTMGNRPAAERTMRRYLARFPNGPRNESFHDYIDAE